MAQILTKIEQILKEQYQPALSNQIGVEPSPFLEKIQKKPLTGHTIVAAAPVGLNGGFGFGSEGVGTPKAGAQRYIRFELDSVDMYVDIQISNKTVQLASTNAAAMLNALDQEIQGSYKSARWNVARALFGAGSGVLTTISALASAGNTVEVADTKYLIEGLTIDFYATGGTTPAVDGRRITAVDRVNKRITFDGSATTLSAGFITVQGSYGKELCGLGAIYDSGVTSLYGLTKSDHPFLAPIVVDADNDISDIVLYQGVKQSKDYKGGNIDLIMMGDDAFVAWQDYMRTNNMHIVEKQRYIGGAVGYKILVGSQEVEVVNERFIPTDEAWGVDTKSFELHQTPWDFVSKDGGIFSLMDDTSIFRALLASYGNLICKNPGACVKFINCEAASE
jgi:hypothetical protein